MKVIKLFYTGITEFQLETKVLFNILQKCSLSFDQFLWPVWIVWLSMFAMSSSVTPILVSYYSKSLRFCFPSFEELKETFCHPFPVQQSLESVQKCALLFLIYPTHFLPSSVATFFVGLSLIMLEFYLWVQNFFAFFFRSFSCLPVHLSQSCPVFLLHKYFLVWRLFFI